MSEQSHLELLFAQQLRGIAYMGAIDPASNDAEHIVVRTLLDVCEREYRFCPPRKWKFDFAFPQFAVAVEIEGGIWKYGRHNRPATMVLDFEKYNTAALLGWKVFRFDSHAILDGEAIEWVHGAITGKQKKSALARTPRKRSTGEGVR